MFYLFRNQIINKNGNVINKKYKLKKFISTNKTKK
jgi:hypothetical protein